MEDIPMLNEYDVVVVGARVAGSTVAALLGDAGYRILLVDRATFPSPTLSTHFFRGNGLVAVLKRLGLLEQALALGAPPLTCQYAYDNGGDQPIREPPQEPGEVGFCLSVRRQPLDALLVQRARATGRVDLAEKTTITGLLWQGERVSGLRLANATGVHEIRARLVIGADGRNSFVARAVQTPIEESEPGHRALYYCYLQHFPSVHGGAPEGPEFSQLGDEVAYLFPSDGGVTCLALSINRSDFRWMKAALSERFHQRITHHRGLADRVEKSTVVSDTLGIGPFPNYVRVPIGPGWALIGDAGMHQDPWSGRGMDMAGVHATFLAEAVIDWLAGKVGEEEALATYHRRRNEHGLAAYRQTVYLSRDLRQSVQA